MEHMLVCLGLLCMKHVCHLDKLSRTYISYYVYFKWTKLCSSSFAHSESRNLDSISLEPPTCLGLLCMKHVCHLDKLSRTYISYYVYFKWTKLCSSSFAHSESRNLDSISLEPPTCTSYSCTWKRRWWSGIDNRYVYVGHSPLVWQEIEVWCSWSAPVKAKTNGLSLSWLSCHPHWYCT